MTQQIYEQWFRIADADKDGAIAGAEAVSFFTRSGLPQLVLGQIWEMSSGGSAKLNQFQFSSAMRLVALAQAHGGQLPVEQARAIVAGVGPNLAPPTMQGLAGGGVIASAAARPVMQPQTVAATGPAVAPPAYAAQATGAAAGVAAPLPYAAQATGAAPPYNTQATGVTAPPPYAVQATGAAAPPYTAQATGATPLPYTAQATGAGMGTSPCVAQATGAAVYGYPPLPVTELQRYQTSFVHLDSDKDGYITGAECFAFFTQFGLDKSILRDIWNLVAGTESRLSATQFIAYLYLMDYCKRGLPLPPRLPPGLAGFPPIAQVPQPPPQPPAVMLTPAPVAAPGLPPPAPAPAPAAVPSPATWSLQSQFGTSSNITAVLASPSVTSGAVPAAQPAMPSRLDLTTGERLAAPAAAQPSRVPTVSPSLLAGVSAMDRTKLQDEQQVCEAKERALQTAEERAAEARARQAALTTALQQLVVFRNRTEVALLTCQDTARRLEEEVEAARKRYEAGYTAAQVASEKSAVLHSRIMELMAQKSELEDKMKRLEGEVAAAERMAPSDVARLEGELAELHSRCTALEAARNAKMAKVDGIRRAQEAARSQLTALQESERDAAAELEGCQAALEQMEVQLKEARASGALTSLPAVLARAASVYRGLYGMAHRAGTAVPFEALPATLTGLHVWADEVAAGVIDWPDDDVDVRGYVIVNALPGADAPRPITKFAPAPTPSAPISTPPATSTITLPPHSSGPSTAPPTKPLPDMFVSLGTPTESFNDPPAFGEPPAFGAGVWAAGSGAVLDSPAAAAVPAADAAAPPAVLSAVNAMFTTASPPRPLATTTGNMGAFYESSSMTFGSGAVDFGFEDPPAFGAATATVAATAPSTTANTGASAAPVQVAALGGLLGEASLSTGTLGMLPLSTAPPTHSAAPALQTGPSHAQDFGSGSGSGFSFGNEDSATFLGNPTPSSSLSAPMSQVPTATAAVADFGYDAFGDSGGFGDSAAGAPAAASFPPTATATTTAATGDMTSLATGGSFRRDGSAASSGFGDPPAFGAPDSAAAAATTAPDPFGGNAFGGGSVFSRISSGSGTTLTVTGLGIGGVVGSGSGGDSGSVTRRTTQSNGVGAEAAAPAPPPLLPGGDSGALEENPFAKPQAPPFMLPNLSITSGGSGGSTMSGAAGQAAVRKGSSGGSPAEAVGGETTMWKANVAVAATTTSTDFGFGDDNPFGDNDNPFGSPAFPQK